MKPYRILLTLPSQIRPVLKDHTKYYVSTTVSKCLRHIIYDGLNLRDCYVTVDYINNLMDPIVTTFETWARHHLAILFPGEEVTPEDRESVVWVLQVDWVGFKQSRVPFALPEFEILKSVRERAIDRHNQEVTGAL